MILYHGVKSIDALNSILSNGLRVPSKSGYYGTGVYATSRIDIALQHTNDDGIFDTSTHPELVLQLEVDDALIYESTYMSIANKFFHKHELKNPSFYCMDPLWHLDEVVKNLGYSGCKINYSDADEVIILDPSIIHNVAKAEIE
jgi:hypothetical protein